VALKTLAAASLLSASPPSSLPSFSLHLDVLEPRRSFI
jgi:hypothetical protein